MKSQDRCIDEGFLKFKTCRIICRESLSEKACKTMWTERGILAMNKTELLAGMEALRPLCTEMCSTIWNMPETGGTEKKSSDYLRGVLEKEGFRIVNEEKLPYAFYAEYGSGHPVIAVLGEYDALPGLSQKVETKKDPVTAGAPGHGCGHNLLGSAAATGAIAVKRLLEQEGMAGTVRFYGCPEEELLSGKVKMAYYHMFDGCDIALSWHPMSANMAVEEGYLALASERFFFHGKTSHAAFAPERGRSALDAVELMSVGANYLREHVPDFTRIHYTTDSGGFSPNIVPDKAGAWYYVRAPHMEDVKDVLRRLELCAKGAATMTETTFDCHIEYGCCEMMGQKSFCDLTWENLKAVPTPVYTEEELQFAKELQKTLDPAILSADQKRYEAEGKALAEGVVSREGWKNAPMTGSSDSGDVSQLMPMNAFTTTCWPVGVAPHTWQSCASAGSSIGQKGAFYAAEVFAATAYDLLTKPELLPKIRAEFEETASKKAAYEPMYDPS